MTQASIRRAKSRASWTAAFGLSLSALPASGQVPTPEGAEFQVNTYTTNAQTYPAVAMEPDGDFVVVWQSPIFINTHPFTSANEIVGRRYASDGSARGGEFQINTYTTVQQVKPAVAVASAGGFVVTWTSDGSSGTDTAGTSIQGQRYASDGSPQGAQFQVNSYTSFNQGDLSVTADADGDFVVVWGSIGSYGSDTDGESIQSQRYASDGSTRGRQFQVNTDTTGFQDAPSVAAQPDGAFVVVWASSTGPTAGIQVQRYASDGSAQGAQFQADTYTTSSQYQASVAAAADGDFVVVWTSNGSPGTDTHERSIQGRRYASGGSAQGAQFQVNTYTTHFQRTPSAAMAADGGFVVVWASNGSSGTDVVFWNIHGQRYTSKGLVQGEEFQVNTYTTDVQVWPAAAARADGDFVVVWHGRGSFGTDTDFDSVHGQRYNAPSAVGVPALSPSMGLVLGAALMLLGATTVARAYGSVSRRSRFSR